MKTRLFILIFALVASAGTLFAESGTLGDNATWNYADGVLTISGTGAMTDFANLMAVPWNAYRRDTRTIIIEDGITHVGDNSFVAFEMPQGQVSDGRWLMDEVRSDKG